MANNLREFYDALKAENYDLPSFEDFEYTLQDKNAREAIYNRLKHVYELPDFETFDYNLGSRPMTAWENTKRLGSEVVETVENLPRIAKESFSWGEAASELNKNNPNAEVLAQEMKAAQPTGQTATERRAAKGTSGGFMPAGFKENPISWLIETAVKSLSEAVPEILDKAPEHVLGSMGTGAAYGLAAGGEVIPGAIAGAGMAVPTLIYNSSAVERQAEFVFDALKKRHVDITDQQAVEKALADKKLIADLKAQAAPGAEVQGFFDGLSVLGAGKAAEYATKKLGKGLVGKVAGEVGEFAAQAGFGTAGEAGAQVTEKGNIYDKGAVVAEALAETPAQGLAARAVKFGLKTGGEAVFGSESRAGVNSESSNVSVEQGSDFEERLDQMANEHREQTGEEIQVKRPAAASVEQTADKPNVPTVAINKAKAEELSQTGLLQKYGFENLSETDDTQLGERAKKTSTIVDAKAAQEEAMQNLPDDLRKTVVEQQAALEAEQTPVEPIPTEQTPVEPIPTEQTPVEPTPTEQTPVEPIPTEQTPVEPTPTEQAKAIHEPQTYGAQPEGEIAQQDTETGKPGAATTEELSSDEWNEASLGKRMYEGESLSEPVKEQLGKTGALYYQQVSHIKTKGAATAYAKGKNIDVLAAVVQDNKADIEPAVRIALGKEVLHQLDARARTLRKKGKTAEAERVEQKAGGLAAHLSKTATKLGRAIEYMKEFDPSDPEGMIGAVNQAIENDKAPFEGSVRDIAEGLNKVNDDAADEVAQDPTVRGRVRKAKRKQTTEKNIWTQYVESISESMDVVEAAKASVKEKGALQRFAADVRRTFLSKIKKPEGAGKPKRSAITVVRDQIANAEKLYAAWSDARNHILHESPNAAKLAQLIPEELDAPFSVADIRKVLRQMGVFNLKNIANAWAEGRSNLIDAVVDTLMQDQPIDSATYVRTESALRAVVEKIAESEKEKLDAVREKLAAERELRAVERQKARAAGEPIRPDKKAVSALLAKLKKEVTPVAPKTPIQEFTRNLISALAEKVTMPGQKAKQSVNYLGLLKEAIENQDKYRDVWEQARAAALEKYPHMAGQLAELFDSLDNVYPHKAIAGALDEEIKAAEVNLTRLIRQHYTVTDKIGRTLGEKIADKLQVSEAEAESIAAAVEEAFKKRVAARKKAALLALRRGRPKVKAVIKDQLDQIIELSNMGALSSDDVFDTVSKKLGIPNATAEDFATLRRLADAVRKEGEVRGAFDYTLEYWKKRKALEDFYLGLVPSHNLRILTGIGGRGNMVASVKSAAANVMGNTALFVPEATGRRIVDRVWRRANTKFGAEYKRHVQQVFRETGYDPTRMMTMADSQKRLGEEVVHTQGAGKVRKMGRIMEDIIFKKLLGDNDVRFAAIHFTDTIDLLSTKMATKMVGEQDVQAKALELFKDAIRVEPLTKEGNAIRERAVRDALRGTLTDENVAARASIGVRKLLNHVSGDLMLGDLEIPFAKTPATVKWRGMEAMGLTAPYDLYRLKKAIAAEEPVEIRDAAKSLVNAGLGITSGLILANMLSPDDYIDDYDFVNSGDKARLRALGGSYGTFRFGSTYISSEYFGPVAAPMAASVLLKKYGSDVSMKRLVGLYVTQGLKLAVSIPGADVIAGVVEGTQKLWRAVQTDEGVDRYLGDARDGIVDFFAARTIPALLGDVAKALDDAERKPRGAGQVVASRIPLLRGTTNPKLDLFSEEMPAQPWYGSLLFGARLKIGRSGEVFDELQRLQSAGCPPALSDIRYTSSRAKRLKKQIGDENYKWAISRYGALFKAHVENMLRSRDYWELDDAHKRGAWNTIRRKALNRMLEEFGYQKK